MCNVNIAAYVKFISPQLARDWRGLGGTLPMNNSYQSKQSGASLGYIDLMATLLSIDKARNEA